MNGGMYNKKLTPQGLYIENGELKSDIDTLYKGYGNFYLQPNGIFFLTDKGKAYISKTNNFKMNKNIKYATQSGPMLVINSKIHPEFDRKSKSLHIRNGVGIFPDGNLLFAMSKKKVSFYDFALFFKQSGCDNALYLDGFISKTYLPLEGWKETNGNFVVIIAEVEN